MFAGRYELVDPLGSGGTGDVWRVLDHREGTHVAAKVMRQADAASLMRFVREQAVRVHHPHVLTPLGWAGEDDRVLFTMPIVRGGSAATLVGDHGPLPARWVATLLDQLLSALAAIHAAGLVHRDVKPANLLLDATGRGMPHLRLADFGIAAAVDEPRLTHGPHVLGTRGYTAPEAFEPGWDPDPRADLYGAGLTAYELLTAQRPSPGDDLAAGLAALDVPTAMTDLVLALAEPRPDDRPASAEEALELLRATGLVAADAAGLGDADVEVFEQVPEVPVPSTAEAPAASTPGAPAAAPTAPAAFHGDRRARPVSRAGLALVVLGLLLIVAAVLLGL